MRIRHLALDLMPWLALLALCATSTTACADAEPQTPQELFQDLFIAVQDSRIFADGKFFVDAVPKSAPGPILEDFRSQRPESNAALAQFVAAHFTLPAAAVDAAAVASPPDH